MFLVYEKYYEEIKGENGKISDVKINYPDSFNFAYDVMDEYAREFENDLALVHKTSDGVESRFTFGDIKKLSDKAANAFKALGIGKGDPVMLLLKRRYEFWISILALHKLGAIAVPTSHMVSVEDIKERALLSHAKAVICVNTDTICEKVESALEGTAVMQLVVGDKYKDKENYGELVNEASDEFERVYTYVHDPMLYYFTSGTNGAPKAVIHDFSYPIAHIYTAKNWHGINPHDLHLTVADSGWAKSAWGKLYGQWFLCAAIMVYDYEQFYAADMLSLLEKKRINTFCAPPTIYKYLVLEDIKKYNLSNLRYCTTAGEPMPVEVSKKFTSQTGIVVREGFGQTETALLISTSIYDEQKEGSIGFKSPLYDIKLVDEDGKEVGESEEGEIVIVSTSDQAPIGVLKGYLGDEKLYDEVFHDGIYHTRDKAIKREDGSFVFVGRNDDVIKSSGYRIGPSEVEDVIMQHPAVFECAVTGFPSKNRGNVVKASIILKKGYEGRQHLDREIQQFVKDRVAIYKYPRIIKFVDDLPRTSNGKISRALIRKKDCGVL